MKGLFVIAGAVALVAGPVASVTLTLDCQVKSTKPGYGRKGIRRLEIDLAAKTARVSDNTGKGFQIRGTRPLVSADANRIVLENGEGKISSVDRRTGRYEFRNYAEKLSITGRCMTASHARQ